MLQVYDTRSRPGVHHEPIRNRPGTHPEPSRSPSGADPEATRSRCLSSCKYILGYKIFSLLTHEHEPNNYNFVFDSVKVF
jgi:hypothetical protein